MSIVERAHLKTALLELLADGREHGDAALVDTLARWFRLSDEQRSQVHAASGRTVFGNEVDWAKAELTQAHLVTRVAPKVYRTRHPPAILRFASKADAGERLTDLAKAGGGEGFSYETGSFDGKPCLVVDEGTLAAFLDPEDEADILAELVKVEVFDDVATRDRRVSGFRRFRAM